MSSRENWDPLKKHERKIKTRVRNSTANPDKKKYIRRRAKIIKQRKDVGMCRNKKEKATQEMLYSILRVFKYTREHNQQIMTTSITNEYTSLYKSHTLYFRKGDVCCE